MMLGSEGSLHECLHDGCGGSIAAEGSQLVASGEALGLPVEDAAAATVGLGAGLVDGAGKLAATLFHYLGVALVDLVAGLYDHDVATVLLADVANVGNTVGDDVIGLDVGLALHGPVGV